MKAKRLVAAGLTAAMTLGLAAGCGNGGNGGSSGNNASANAGDGGEIVTLKWITIGNGMPSNYDTWIEKINAYAGEKIGVNLDLEVISWGDWDKRRNVVVTTNEPYDIIFGNGNNYIPDINLGAYYDITDLIEENMPGLCELMPDKYWDAVKVDGKIYGVPTYKDSAISNYAVWDKEIVDEYGIDITALTEIPDLTPTFEKLKADKNDYPVYVKNDGVYYIFDKYDQIGGGTQVLGVRYDDTDAKVVFTLEQDDIMAELKAFHEWYKKGIINPDAATLTEARVYNMWRVAQGWESAAKTVWGPDMNKEVVVQKIGDTILSNETVRGSINMISANTKYPEKCLQFLDLLNTDSWMRDMFFYGEEGVNFEYNEDGTVHRINTDFGLPGYTQATFFTVTREETDEYGQWDEVKALNDNAVASQMLGFTFDTSRVSGLEDKLKNCGEVWLRYKSEVMTGVRDPETTVPEIKEELMKAGFQEILDEAQAQVDEFMKTK